MTTSFSDDMSTMDINREYIRKLIEDAITTFWQSRKGAKDKQSLSGARDVGERSAVTNGKNMGGFSQILPALLELQPAKDISLATSGKELIVPGYRRPSKKWDTVARRGDNIILSLEMKSHIGPSFGNNFNNRTEEAVGSADDLWRAYNQGILGEHRPFLGYLILLEDCLESRKPVKGPDGTSSYVDRYREFCEKVVFDRLYDEAVLLPVARGANTCSEIEDAVTLFLKATHHLHTPWWP